MRKLRGALSVDWWLGLLSLLLFLGLAYGALSLRDFRHDLSAGQRNLLAPLSIDLLERLDVPVEAVAWYAEGAAREPLRELFDQMREHGPQLSLRFIDPAREPALARAAGIRLERTVQLHRGEIIAEVVDPNEASIVGGLLQLMEEDAPYLLVAEGVGGARIDDSGTAGISRLVERLRRQNHRIEGFPLLPQSRIPEECDLFILAAPERNLGAAERAIILDYLMRGGRLLAMLEPMGSVGADSLARSLGIIAYPAFIIDPSEERRDLAGMGSFKVALGKTASAEHAITRGFDWYTLLPLARPLGVVQPPPPGLRSWRILESSGSAWGEFELSQMVDGRPEFADGIDLGGPLGLAYALEMNPARFRSQWEEENSFLSSVRSLTGPSTVQARAVVVGDVDFVGNANLDLQGNQLLFNRMLSWLLGNDERIELDRPLLEPGPVVLRASQLRWLRLGSAGLVPLLPLLWAGVIWWQRRRSS